MQTCWLTSSPGLEDVAADELAAALGGEAEPCPDGLVGHALVHSEAAWPTVKAAALGLRGAHRALRLVGRAQVSSLAELKAVVAGLAPAMTELDGAESFRVTCQRSGSHEFGSEEAAREAGSAIRGVWGTPVKLKGAAVEVRCDLRGERLWVGVAQHVGSLSTRWAELDRLDVSLRGNVAWAMGALAQLDVAPAVVLDPCCGAGTTLLEAGVRWPEAQLWGGDLHAEVAARALANLEAALPGRAVVKAADVRKPGEAWPEASVDLLLCNLPFGMRVGQGLELGSFTRAALKASLPLLRPGGRAVWLGRSAGLLASSVGAGWMRRHLRTVDLGGHRAGVLVLERA